MSRKIIYLLFSITFFSCSKNLLYSEYKKSFTKKKSLTEFEHQTWENLDIEKDTVPGISLNRAFNEIIKTRKGEKIIIAVLDTEIDTNHPVFKNTLWINTNEIPNNRVDDDKNGYIDDVNGWNFLGNNKGESIINNNYESQRVISYFKQNVIKTRKDSILYKKAILIQEEIDKSFSKEKRRIDFYKSVFPQCFKTIKKFFPQNKYTAYQIDSLFQKNKDNSDKQLSDELYFLNDLKKYDLDSTWVSNNIKAFEIECKTLYNKEYQEKSITNDNPFNLKDSIYGNNDLSKHAKEAWHNTQVSGLISKNLSLKNNINFKIMPIVMVASRGEENDKDVAIAIRYAVNNGARIINMSFGKKISLNSIWVREAILYAQEKNTLIICASGNSGINTDNSTIYPIDNEDTELKEFCDNFIKVGGNYYPLSQNFLYENSNFGKNTVDFFAPANNLFVPDATKINDFNSGTSLASAITTSVAALVRSYYPKLSAAQVKQILLDSCVKYDLEVQVPGEKEGTLKPFKELSKSGGVVNAYNALLMAKELSKKKK